MAASWLNPPLLVDPQPAAPPNITAPPPSGASLPVFPTKAPPAFLAKAPPVFPADAHVPVAAPVARERKDDDLWNYTPITITKTLEDSVRATEKRINDNVNSKISELLNVIKDLERQVVLLREDSAVKERIVTTRDQGTDPWVQPSPWTGYDDWWQSSSYGNKTENSWDKDDKSSWEQHATADSTGGEQSDDAHDQWSKAWWRAKAMTKAQQHGQ